MRRPGVRIPLPPFPKPKKTARKFLASQKAAAVKALVRNAKIRWKRGTPAHRATRTRCCIRCADAGRRAGIGCCPLLLRGSFKAGRSRANKWVGFFRRAVQLPLQSIEVPKLVIDAYGAKGRLRLRPEYLLDGLISQC